MDPARVAGAEREVGRQGAVLGCQSANRRGSGQLVRDGRPGGCRGLSGCQARRSDGFAQIRAAVRSELANCRRGHRHDPAAGHGAIVATKSTAIEKGRGDPICPGYVLIEGIAQGRPIRSRTPHGKPLSTVLANPITEVGEFLASDGDSSITGFTSARPFPWMTDGPQSLR